MAGVRLFVAIDVPEAIRTLLVKAKRSIETARWVPEDQIHLTLRFIGDTELDQQKRIESELAEVVSRAAPFTVRIEGVGQFPKNRPAHVLWGGITPADNLVAVAKLVDEAVTGAGVAPADKPFSPHITLARIKDAPRKSVAQFLDEHAKLSSPPFVIDEVSLYSSILSSKGAQHAVERRFKLGIRAAGGA